MTRHTLKKYVLPLALLGLALSTSNSLAQGALSARLPHPQPGTSHPTAPASDGILPASSAYTFTFINYPGQLNTQFVGVNLGATASQQMMVGTDSYESNGGFVVDFSNTDGVATETFGAVQNYPGSTYSYPLGINNSGQIIGVYYDSAGVSHGYVLFDGNFTAFNVPFQGAEYTYPECINDQGDIVGIWDDAGQKEGFEEIGGVYTVIQVPGATSTFPYGINDSGVVVGAYVGDGTSPGFELSGGVYTTIQVPGAAETVPAAINNAGEIVGYYCPTSACDVYGGFILKGGVYSKIAVPEATSTVPYNVSDAGVIAGNYYDGKLATALSYGFVAVPK
jgi:hypothetical protein